MTAVGYPPSLQPTPDPFAFGNFNTSASNYTGPQFPEISYDYYAIGPYVRQLKYACHEQIGPGPDKWTFLVAECVMRNLNEQAKANLASYNYMLTLWPTIVSLFASLGPDASDAAYDNIFWSVLLAITSGAMAGFRSPENVPHNIRAYSLEEAQKVCEQGEQVYRGQVAKVGRYSPRRRVCSPGFSRSEWWVMIMGYLFWAIFLVIFCYCLTEAFYYNSTRTIPTQLEASLWFWLSSLPAFLKACG